jgi:hypothetical protein
VPAAAGEVVLDHLHDDRGGGVGSDAAVLDEGDDGDLGVVGGGVGGEPGVVLGGVEALEGGGAIVRADLGGAGLAGDEDVRRRSL